MRFLTNSLDTSAKTLTDNQFVYLKNEFDSNWNLFTEKMAYPYKYFKSNEDYERLIEELIDLSKEVYYNTLHKKYPNQVGMERTNNLIELLNIKKCR